MQKSQSFIKTYIRIRPPTSQNIFKDSKDDKLLNCCDKVYRFSHVFSPQSSDEEIFDKIGFQLIDNTVNGYNSTLFAYGQTGTGKTYTMTGNSTKVGLVQRCVNLLFRRLQMEKQFQYYSLKISYIEIYNEAIRDLLSEREGKIMIRQLAKSGFYIEGLESVQLGDEQGFNRELRRGLLKRSTKTTKMNEVSSRSHTIMTVFLQTKKLNDQNGILVRLSKLNFVDLAGSEKQKQTQVSGSELKQASSINKSLTTLSLVISKLGEKQTKNAHIPYRESVLTKVLKDSIGGNSRTIFIGTISAQKTWVSETISTLLFLERLKNVRNIVQVNEKIEGKEQELIKRIKNLQEKISQMEQNIENISKCHKEDLLKLDRSQIQIKQLEEMLMCADIDNFFFVENAQVAKQDIFSEINRKNQSILHSYQSNSQRLSVIEETSQKSSQKKSKINNNLEYIPQTEIKNKRNSKPFIQEQLSLKKSTRKSTKNFWILQNQFLKEQIQKYLKQDEQYNEFIKLIESNIKSFKFDDAQIFLFQSLEQRSKNAQNHLQAYKQKFEQLSAFSESQLTKVKSQQMEVRSLQLDNISKKSIYLSNQNKLKEQIQLLQKRLVQINQLKNSMQNTFRAHIFKCEQENLQLQGYLTKIEDEARLIKQENIKLNQMINVYKSNDLKNYENTQLSSSWDTTDEQKQQLKLKIQQLEMMIEDDLMMCIQQQEKTLESIKIDKSLLLQENTALKDKIKELQEGMEKQKISIMEIEGRMLKKYQVEGYQITFQELLHKYNQLLNQSNTDKQNIQILKKELKNLINEFSILQSRLQNEKESYRQSQTYFRHEIKVKGLEISKMKSDNKRQYDQTQQVLYLNEKNSQIIQQLNQKLIDFNKMQYNLQQSYRINQELCQKIDELESKILELTQQNKINNNKVIEQYVKQNNDLRESIIILRQENNVLYQKYKAENGYFCESLRTIARINKLYRTQQCYFYRFKVQYQKSLQILKKQNERLMTQLASNKK